MPRTINNTVNKSAQRGDLVEFTPRGKILWGTVTRVYLKHSKKAEKALRGLRLAGADISGESADTVCLEIAEKGSTSFWKGVRQSSVRVVGTGDLGTAKDQVYAVKGARRKAEGERKHANFEIAEARNLFSLNERGDHCEVQFKDGWRSCIFKGFVSGTFNVRFLIRLGDKARTTNPQYVRCVSKEA
jgi:hypothetical protein